MGSRGVGPGQPRDPTRDPRTAPAPKAMLRRHRPPVNSRPHGPIAGGNRRRAPFRRGSGRRAWMPSRSSLGTGTNRGPGAFPGAAPLATIWTTVRCAPTLPIRTIRPIKPPGEGDARSATLGRAAGRIIPASRPSTADVKIIPVQDATAIDPFSEARDAEVRSGFSTDGGASWTVALHRRPPTRRSVHPIPCHLD